VRRAKDLMLACGDTLPLDDLKEVFRTALSTANLKAQSFVLWSGLLSVDLSTVEPLPGQIWRSNLHLGGREVRSSAHGTNWPARQTLHRGTTERTRHAYKRAGSSATIQERAEPPSTNNQAGARASRVAGYERVLLEHEWQRACQEAQTRGYTYRGDHRVPRLAGNSSEFVLERRRFPPQRSNARLHLAAR